MRIHEILGRKGQDIVAIDPGGRLSKALRLLVNHGIGSVLVKEGDKTLGILTERDILRVLDRDPAALEELTVGEAMTHELIVAVPDDDVSYVMEILTKNRIRHLPVMVDGTIQGIISIGDVVNALRRETESENRYLRDYVQGMVR
jgi:CBS domain-containing protein